MKIVSIQWGWATPGVPRCNREKQEGKYLDFLDGQNNSRVFNFTHPGWTLDSDISPTVRDLTGNSTEKARNNTPFSNETMDRWRQHLDSGKLRFLVYPYSGTVVEGTSGETVLKNLRFSKQIAETNLGQNPEIFMIHDSPSRLDWNSPMIPQIGKLIGFKYFLGSETGKVVSPDGSCLTMLGAPLDDSYLWDFGEMPHAPEHIEELLQEHVEEELDFIPIEDIIPSSNLPEFDSCDFRTKGWYGGTPLGMKTQASLRRCDLKLAGLAGLRAMTGVEANLDDYWKKSLIIQDVHLQWFLIDLDHYYLPETRKLEEAIDNLLTNAIKGTEEDSLVFNPLPFSRDGILVDPDDKTARYIPTIQPFSTSPVIEFEEDPEVTATENSLANNLIKVDFGLSGEITKVTDNQSGETIYQGNANCLRHWLNEETSGSFTMKTGEFWSGEDFCGNLTLTTEIEIPEDGTYDFEIVIPRGMSIAFGCEGETPARATNPHWGCSLPSAGRDPEYSGVGNIELKSGLNRLVIYGVADLGFEIVSAELKRNGQSLKLDNWQGEKNLAWVPDKFQVTARKPLNLGAQGAIVFSGSFATCQATLTVSLDHNSDRVEVKLVREYLHTVHEGLQTLPLPSTTGSYLGSACERPYVPAFSVETSTAPQKTTYTSDKPFGFSEAKGRDKSWFTGKFQELYAGLTPFLGIFTGIAESDGGSTVIISDGHNHFFKREDQNQESEFLGLSLGATIIHPQTQGYRINDAKEFAHWGRPMGMHDSEDAYRDFEFTAMEGKHTVKWSLLFSKESTFPRQKCHKELMKYHLGLLPATREVSTDFAFAGDECAITGMEKSSEGYLIRIVNFSGTEKDFSLILPFESSEITSSGELIIKNLSLDKNQITGILSPLAIRELVLT